MTVPRQIDFEAFGRELLAQARTLIPEWIPGGKWRGREYVCGSIQGGEGESFSINAETGKWAEFGSDATNGASRGGDLIALYAAIHGFNQREAALALGAVDKPNGHANGHAEYAPPQVGASGPAIIPPNVPITAAAFRHSTDGLPSAFWIYRTAQADPIMVVARYDTPSGKQIRPWVWDIPAVGKPRWRCRSLDKPRPLYGLDRLATIDAPAVIVEGEKTADAAQRLFPENPCLTWPGGTGGVGHVDLAPLKGRGCLLWPDNDVPGRNAMASLGAALVKLGCVVNIIDPAGWPESWDLADATPSDDVHKYADEHSVNPATPPLPAPTTVSPTARLLANGERTSRLQTTPEPAATVIHAPLPGSLDELYARYAFNRKSNGRPYCNQFNVERAITARIDQGTLGGFYFDAFAQRVMVIDADACETEWTDALNLQLTSWLQNTIELYEIKPGTVRDGVAAYAFAHTRNPVRDWLLSTTWDGTQRLLDLLPVGFGTDRDDYHEAVGRCFMVGMVARVMRPGCQVDAMPVFEGNQGNGKTSALRILGGEYFAEVHDSIMSKDFPISLAGKMLCEISELGAFRTADIDRIKGIITTATDRYRAPYERTAVDHPRQGVFSGTTNRDDWNTDETGARRFWPVACGRIDLPWLRQQREQVFAEAVERYQKDEEWWDVPPTEAERLRTMRQDADPWDAAIAAYLVNHPIVQIPHVMADVLLMKLEHMDGAGQRRVGRILKRHGYRKEQRWINGANVKQWERKP